VAQSGDTGVHILQVEMTSAVTSGQLRTLDLVASGTGDDASGITLVQLVHEDQLTLNGVFDGADTVAWSGTYPSEDGTASVVLATPIPLPLAQLESFLVLCDFSMTAQGTAPPATFDATMTSVDTFGVTLTPTGDPTGGAEVRGCLGILCGDCSLDGSLSILDALAIAQAGAGLGTTLTCCV
jgi:hypothetical protein